MNLLKKRAIVTGSTKGIGLAIAESLLRHGTNVVITSRHEDAVAKTVADLEGTGPGKVIGKNCDVSNADKTASLIDFCLEQLGGLDILINNAGVGIFKNIEDMSLSDWDKTIGTNLNSLFYCCRSALPELKRAGEGFIINIGSLAGKNAFPGGIAYNASKFGLVGFSEALMQDVRHDNIRVAYIMPGSVDTWFGGSPPVGQESWKLSAPDVADVVVDTLTRSPRCLTSRIEMRPSKPPKK